MNHYLLFLLLSAAFSFLIGKPLICFLSKLGAKQTIREEGPKAHIQKKSKTPTIGGLIFLIPVTILTLFIYFSNSEFQSVCLLVALCTTLALAVLGFIDDYLKVIKNKNKGISGWTKLFVQFIISFIIFLIYKDSSGFLYLIWIFFIISGSSNSYNLTDGLDGLLGSISLASFLGFVFLFLHQERPELVCFSLIFFGALLGFLYFNKHPAKIFMGDTGSLAIGGAIGSLAIISKAELILIFFASIPILEALSVILQVASCQLSKRFLKKDIRIFKMTPLHHHFELVGWKEIKIVERFFAFQLFCTIIGIVIILLV